MKIIFLILLLLVLGGASFYFWQRSTQGNGSLPTAYPQSQSTTAPILQNDSQVIDTENTVQQSGSYDTQK